MTRKKENLIEYISLETGIGVTERFGNSESDSKVLPNKLLPQPLPFTCTVLQ